VSIIIIIIIIIIIKNQNIEIYINKLNAGIQIIMLALQQFNK